ncbi:MAG: 1-deoxy-D-xylulose-5-phosphate reductoisomerase, partial [Acidobacteria bacterium]|nr:1-deoxy-D-xylulose-5-phosphate reductoisomerase [Acidobacteriota bacterium]
MRQVAILGSTGSIGQSALAVVAAHPDRLRVVAMAAGENIARFVVQV